MKALLPALLAAALVATGCGTTTPTDPNPLAGDSFYVDPAGHAVQQMLLRQHAGDDRGALALRPLAAQPTGVWFTGNPSDPQAGVADLTTRAAAQGKVAVITLYNLPQRDCGAYSSGGAATTRAYQSWLTSVARGIATRKTVAVLEPDAIPHTLQGCGTSTTATQRYQLLAWAVDTLRTNAPHALVYIDAGNAAWIKDLTALAAALRASGVGHAGFALNVSNFVPTKASIDYATRLSELVGGAHFVIDTSRNGNGSPPLTSDRQSSWCNPPGRAPGTPPTSRTATKHLDALLWIKQPGDSDGTCHGGPPAGTWSAALAQDLLNGRTSA